MEIATILKESIQQADASQKIKIGICGGISPDRVKHICAIFKPDLLCTKMFIAKAAGLIDNPNTPYIINALLVLEIRILDLILMHRSAVSSIITSRKDSLVRFIQATTVNHLVDAGE